VLPLEKKILWKLRITNDQHAVMTAEIEKLTGITLRGSFYAALARPLLACCRVLPEPPRRQLDRY
jgi:hypothetical protein